MSKKTSHFRKEEDGGPVEHCSNNQAMQRRMTGEKHLSHFMGEGGDKASKADRKREIELYGEHVDARPWDEMYPEYGTDIMSLQEDPYGHIIATVGSLDRPDPVQFIHARRLKSELLRVK